jgi:hypothetical protein
LDEINVRREERSQRGSGSFKRSPDFINNPVVRGNGRSIKNNNHDWRSFEK